MVPALNTIGTSVACLGNHDLDFGVEQFERLAAQCNFSWLCANVLDPALGEDVPLGHCKRTTMLTSSTGIKIGVIGVVEREWLDTINTLPPNLKYLSASATVSELAPKLRADGAEIVVVVSHQREPNDNKLAEKVAPGTVDIVLGGHDHFYQSSVINGTHVLRSGSDFKQLSYIEAWRGKDGNGAWSFKIVRRDITSSVAEDSEAATMVHEITDALKAKLDKPIGYTAAPLDARFTTVRLKESNLGNFVCDIMKLHYGADCALMAAGTIRGDQIYPPGECKAVLADYNGFRSISTMDSLNSTVSWVIGEANLDGNRGAQDEGYTELFSLRGSLRCHLSERQVRPGGLGERGWEVPSTRRPLSTSQRYRV